MSLFDYHKNTYKDGTPTNVVGFGLPFWSLPSDIEIASGEGEQDLVSDDPKGPHLYPLYGSRGTSPETPVGVSTSLNWTSLPTPVDSDGRWYPLDT